MSYAGIQADTPGAAGTESRIFEAVSSGTVEVQMTYSQPRVGGEKEARAYNLYVTVD